jgi:FAD/FMN-containing dehydrogenase
MNKILEIDVDNLTVTLEAGIINGNLQGEAEK